MLRPWRRALRLDRIRPCAVRGPVLFNALARLADILRSEGIPKGFVEVCIVYIPKIKRAGGYETIIIGPEAAAALLCRLQAHLERLDALCVRLTDLRL